MVPLKVWPSSADCCAWASLPDWPAGGCEGCVRSGGACCCDCDDGEVDDCESDCCAKSGAVLNARVSAPSIHKDWVVLVISSSEECMRLSGLLARTGPIRGTPPSISAASCL